MDRLAWDRLKQEVSSKQLYLKKPNHHLLLKETVESPL